MTLATRIKRRRAELKYSIKQVAEMIEQPVSNYAEWENGRQIRGENVYPKLAEVLGMSLSELIIGDFKEELSNELKKIEECVRNIRLYL